MRIGDAVEGLTSGFEPVDALIEGVRAGDNLVVQGEQGVPLGFFSEQLIAAMRARRPVVLCNVAEPWAGPEPADVVVLDWHPVLSGQPSGLSRALAPDATVADACDLLAAVDEEVGQGAVFVLDSLTAIQEAWGPEGSLDLFLWACPRLFRRSSVALWPLDRPAHRPSFLMRLEEITQVVLDVRSIDEALEVEVVKADGRTPSAVGRKVQFTVRDGDVSDVGPVSSGRTRLGRLIRGQRTARGLSQAELARRIGITPSALSQVERGVRGLAADTLMRAWEVLDVPFGPQRLERPGYRIARRSARQASRLADGLTAEQIVDDPDVGTFWRVVVDPGASGRQPPLAVKAAESVIVLRGVFDVELGGHSETLHEGDGLVVSDTVITAWANPATDPAELLWFTRAPSSTGA